MPADTGLRWYFADPAISFEPDRFDLKRLKDMGYHGIELLLEGKMLQEHRLAQLAERLEVLGLALQCHAPFSDLNIATPRRTIREVSLSELKRAVELCSAVNSPMLTLHPGHRTPLVRRFEELSWELMLESVSELRAVATSMGVQLVVENMPYPKLSFLCSIRELVEFSRKAGIGCCIDLGHLHVAGYDLEVVPYLQVAANIHIHDNMGPKRDMHLVPGAGNAPLERWVRALQEMGYRGPVVFEGRSCNDAAAGMEWFRRIQGLTGGLRPGP